MKHSKLVGLGLLFTTILMGCGGGGEDAVMKEQISIMNDMAAAFEGVTDVKSMEAAKTKVDSLKKRAEDLQSKVKNWSDDKKKAMGERYQTELKAATERMMKAMMTASMKAMPGGGLKIPGLP